MSYERGFSLIELMMAIAIFAIAMSIAIPQFTRTVADNKVRSTAESILAGLRDARSSAIQRNAPVRFQLVSSLDSTCALMADSLATAPPTPLQWITTETNQVGTGDPTNKCNMAPWSPEYPCANVAGHNCTSDPFIITKSSLSPDPSITVTADQPIVVFSPLGRITNDALTGYGSNAISLIKIRSIISGTKQLNIVVKPPNGSVKICNAGVTAGSANGC